MSQDNSIADTVCKYETFMNDVLKEDLRQLDLKLQQVNAEISDLISQKHTLKSIMDKNIHPDGFKTQVNLGCNFFMEACVHDTSSLLFNIGLNHYLEFTHEEANRYIDNRIKVFEEKAREIHAKSAENKAHMKLMLMGLSELQAML